MNFINEYKMIYSYYDRNKGVGLLAKMKSPEPLEEWHVKGALAMLIRQELEWGNNPYEQVREMRCGSWETGGDLHNPSEYYTIPNPDPEDGEAMNAPRNINQLVNWIMETEEMQEAFQSYMGQNPEEPERKDKTIFLLTDRNDMDEEEEPRTLTETLYGIVPSEGDWQ